MDLLWITKTETFIVVKIPREFELYALELDRIILNNIRDPIIKELFDKTKGNDGKKIDHVVDFAVHIPLPSPIPPLATYEYEFLLCLEYLFLEDKSWVDCKFSSTFFTFVENYHLPKVRIPVIETDYKRLAEFLETCYNKKIDYKVEMR